jgi:hypothetical protein
VEFAAALDLTNPATLDYQMAASVLPAARAGYNAIALDNYQLVNSWEACGAFRGPNGTWVQLYNATKPWGGEADPTYAHSVLNWTQRAVKRIHEAGLLVVVNRFIPAFTQQNLAVANLTDGIVAEPGFAAWTPRPGTGFGTGPGGSHNLTVPPPKTTPAVFDAQVAFVRHLQEHGKGFFSINEWGAGPDYGLNPSRQPHNISELVAGRAIRQFSVAAFMMTNGRSSAMFLSCAQCYGGDDGGLGNLSLWPEYSAPVGHPTAEPAKDPGSGVWSREYSGAIALVNPANVSRTVALSSDCNWADLYGKPVHDGGVVLPAASGRILLKKQIAGSGGWKTDDADRRELVTVANASLSVPPQHQQHLFTMDCEPSTQANWSSLCFGQELLEEERPCRKLPTMQEQIVCRRAFGRRLPPVEHARRDFPQRRHVASLPVLLHTAEARRAQALAAGTAASPHVSFVGHDYRGNPPGGWGAHTERRLSDSTGHGQASCPSPRLPPFPAFAAASLRAHLGLSRIVALYYCASNLHQNC